MAYAAQGNPVSPYKLLQNAQKPQAGQSVDKKIDRFHTLLRKEAMKLGGNTAIIESYKRFQKMESETIWYFTQIFDLDGATKRPTLPAVDGTTAAWTASWNGLRLVARQAICDLAGQEPESINLGSTDTREALLSGLAKWPSKLLASGQGAETALTGWTCSVFVGEALCQTARSLGLSDKLFLQQQSRDKSVALKFIGAQSMVKCGLFEKVTPEKVKAGYIGSLGGGHHVEIVTQVESDNAHFCSIGAGRDDFESLGQQLCGSDDVWFLGMGSDRRSLDNSESTFLRLKPDGSVTNKIIKSIKD